MTAMKLYLDVCVLSRPFDDQTIMRNHLEANATSIILSTVRNARYGMLVSPVHDAELAALDDIVERTHLQTVLLLWGTRGILDTQLAYKRAEELCRHRLGVADAAHIACAEQAADVFLSCDDRLLRQCARAGVTVDFMNPVEFCIKENLR
jgi:predicted nucleic acid-binding protein